MGSTVLTQFIVPNSVVLGSVVELPADSCKEIKLSENGAAASGIYWLDPVRSGKIFEVYCDMNTEGENLFNPHTQMLLSTPET